MFAERFNESVKAVETSANFLGRCILWCWPAQPGDRLNIDDLILFTDKVGSQP